MKKLIILFAVVINALALSAQAPHLFNYQAVIRDATGQILASQSVSIRIALHEKSSVGVKIYQEEHFVTTNDYGIVHLHIGSGTNKFGKLEDAKWGDDVHVLSIAVDQKGGNNYTVFGYSQLVSVPYALYAANVSYSDTSATNEIQMLSYSNDTLYLSNGNSVYIPATDYSKDISDLRDSIVVINSKLLSVEQQVKNDSIYLNTLINNHVNSDADLDSTNEIQNLSISGNTLSISKGNSIIIPGAQNNDNDSTNELITSIQFTGTTLSITDAGGTKTVSLASLMDNTDAQFLNISGNVLSIGNGNSVTLPGSGPNYDNDSTNELNSSVSFSGNTLTITDAGGAKSANLSALLDNTDSQVLSLSGNVLSITGGNSLTLPGSTINLDNDSTNEIQTQSLSGNNLTLSKGGGTVSLASFMDNTDGQTLTIAGSTLTISGGNSVTLPSGGGPNYDNDSTNEIQTVTLNANNLMLSNGGGTVSLASYLDNTDAQAISFNGDTLYLSNGGWVYLGAYTNTDAQALSLSGNTLSISGGNSITLPGSTVNLDNDSTNELQNLSVSGNTLSISNGNTVTLPASLPNYDNDSTNEIQSLSINSDTVFISNSNYIVLPTGTVNTDDQNLSLSGDTLYIEDGTPVVLSQYVNTDSQALSISGSTLTISGGNSVTLPSGGGPNNDNDSTNELQNLSINSDTIFISQGNFVVLPSGTVNTDDQNLSLSGDTLFIEDGNAVLLSSYLDNTDSQTLSLSGNTLSISGGNSVTLASGAVNHDNDSTNELINSMILSNDTLSITDAGGTKRVGLGSYLDNTDAQALSLSGDTIYLSNGGFVKLPAATSGFDGDSSSTNELQNLALSSDTLSISNGNYVVLPSGTINTDDQNLTLSGDTLKIEDGNFVVIPSAATNNDNDSTNELQAISISNDTIFLSNGGYVKLPILNSNGDTLGNHEMTQNLKSNGFYLSGDGDNEGVFITNDGKVGIGTNTVSSVSAMQVKGEIWVDSLRVRNVSSTSYAQYGIYNWMSGTGSGRKTAIVGTSSGGSGDGIGVYGVAQDGAVNKGIVGYATGGTKNWAGYFETGNVYIKDTLNLPTGAGAGKVLTSDANGNASWQTVSSASPNLDNDSTNEIQSLSVVGNNLTISKGNSVTLPSAPVNYDNDSTNELNTSVALIGTTLAITDAGGTKTANLASLKDNTDSQTLSLSGSTLSIAGGNSVTLPTAATNYDNDSTNELNTSVALIGTTLAITDGGGTKTANLSSLNTDSQTLSLSGSTLSIAGGNSVTLPAGGASNDNDSTNELNSAFTLASNNLTITDAGGAKTVSLAPYLDNTDAQTLSLSGNTLSISGGNNVTLPSGGSSYTTKGIDSVLTAGSNAAGLSMTNLGSLGVNNGITANNIRLTNGAGANKILTSDASGNATWQSPSTVSAPSEIKDTDNDTKIQVEESADEDIIRFDLAGSERWIMIGTRIEPVGTGGSVFIGDQAGSSDDLTNNHNTLIGNFAGRNITTGADNVAIGRQALNTTSTGYNNTAIGSYSLNSNTSGFRNSAIGYQSLYSNLTGDYNVAMGYAALYQNSTASYNIALGIGALYKNNAAGNVGIGYLSMYDNVSGSYNVAMGYQALRKNINGSRNISLGMYSMYNMLTGSYNVVLGQDALYNNINGIHNIVMGYRAGYTNYSGARNIFLGYQAGYNETGSDKLYIESSNSANPLIYGDFANDSLRVNGSLTVSTDFVVPTGAAVGRVLTSDANGKATWQATGAISLGDTTQVSDLDNDTKIQMEESSDEDMIRFDLGGTEQWVMTGARIEPKNSGSSVFIGENAGRVDDLTANNNAFIGYQSGYTNTSGYHNTALGYRSLRSNSIGYRNTAIGYDALYSNVSGHNNTALGWYSLRSNSAGLYNTAIGNYSLRLNSAGNYNTATGYYAMGANTNGLYNTADGYYALGNNSNGQQNTALGASALRLNSNGSRNTGVGYQSAYYTTSGLDNSSLGYRAGFYNSTGNQNTFVGVSAGPGSSSSFSNTTALGYNARTTASNQVRIGNNSVTSIGGFQSWSNVSDARFKKNVEEKVVGLDFILALRPVTYNLDMNAIAAFHNTNDSLRNIEAEKAVEAITQTGFIAQEVEESAKKLGYDFSGVEAPKNANDNYSLRYSEFVVPLVKGMQEQQKLIDEQKVLIEALIKRIESLEAK